MAEEDGDSGEGGGRHLWGAQGFNLACPLLFRRGHCFFFSFSWIKITETCV